MVVYGGKGGGIFRRRWFNPSRRGFRRSVISKAAVTVTTLVPAAASLVLSGFAPVLKNVVIPPRASLALTSSAPVLKNVIVPGTAVLSLTGSAPVLRRVVIPPAASLALTASAPVLKNVVVPAAASLALSTTAPVLKKVIIPPAASLALTTSAPVLRGIIIPPAATLALTTSAPVLQTVLSPASASLALSTTAPVLKGVIVPPAASLILSGSPPVLRSIVVPQTASLALTGFAPEIRQGIYIVPGTAFLSLTGFAPQLRNVVAPPAASLALTSSPPSLRNVVVPQPASLTLTGFAPVVISARVIVPGTAFLALTGFPPQLRNIIVPPAAQLALTTSAPTIIRGHVIVPDTAFLSLLGFPPSIGNVIVPPAGQLVLTGFPPNVIVMGSGIVVPQTALLTLTTFAPDVYQIGCVGQLLNRLQAHFKTNVEDVVAVPVQYDNSPLEPPDADTWIRLAVNLDSTDMIEFSERPIFRIDGSVVASVFSMLEDGDRDALVIADLVKDTFRRVAVGNAVFQAPSIQRIGRTMSSDYGLGAAGARWQIDVSCPFHADCADRLGPTVVGANASFLDTLTTIRDRFKTLVEVPEGVSVQYDNAPFDPPTDDIWVALFILPGESLQVARGVVGRYRSVGVAMAHVFQPIEDGQRDAIALAEKIAYAFRAVSDREVRFQVPHVRPMGRTARYWEVNVQIPYFADELA